MLFPKFSGFCSVLVIVMVCGLFQLVIPASSQAVYRYQDAQGNTCFADDWRVIPPELRASAVPPIPVERAVAPTPTAMVPPAESIAVTPSPQPEGTPPPEAAPIPALLSEYLPASVAGLWNNFWVRLAAFFAVAIVLVFLVLKLTEYIPSPLVGRLILLACFLAVFVTGYKLYVENMTANFFSMKKQMLGLMEKANKREETSSPAPPPQ